MFSRILIANRGEIACRIIRTAQRMGIETVAIYSEADASALHVRMADQAVSVGPSPAAESYLVIDRIVQAARDTGAEAVHPGFGFLSENPTFADALAAAGIVFIGPPTGAIAAMGDKIESKRLAQKAGVSTVPGHPDIVPDAKAAATIAKQIGYPVMIKASAGGGGKGMRIAVDDAGVREGFQLAANEAKSSFGDDRIFIEKFIEQPRHIEIQVLADGHGNIIHLGERECSIQRRHQKVIEEAPSPFIDDKTRAAMGAEAVALAKAVEYQSAGTVEFIVDKDRNFYFLEMNTRLQVEHPVTEFVTGLDLVEQMIRVAAGEELSIRQEDVTLNGWAIEARLYAEDPRRNFLPSTGRLVRYREPAHGPQLRVDSGVSEGGEISMFYDPMIAKLIAAGTTRDAAINRLREALDAFHIRGISHNVAFLAAVLAHPRFAEGRLSTAFIDEEFPDGYGERTLTEEEIPVFLAVAGAIHCRSEFRKAALSGQPAGGRPAAAQSCVARMNGKDYPLELSNNSDTCSVHFKLGRRTHKFDVSSAWSTGNVLFRGRIDGRDLCFQVDRDGIGWRLFHGGVDAMVTMLPRRAADLLAQMPEKELPDLSRFLLSPMPGLLIRLAVAEGEEVKAGEELAVVEAMKMENVLRAERDGIVKILHAGIGDSLAVDQSILEFE